MVVAQGSGDDAGSLVSCFLPAGHGGATVAGLDVGPRLPLLAMAGTHTRPVGLVDVLVPDADVAAVEGRAAWLLADAIRSSDANPALFGVARGAISELDFLARQRDDPGMARLVDALVAECRSVRAASYALADDDSVGDRLVARRRLRAAACDLASRAATAVVVARAGAAMRRGCSAERRAREALFLQVQAQTAATRAASIELLSDRAEMARLGLPTLTATTSDVETPDAFWARSTHE